MNENEDKRNPEMYGRRDTDAIGAEFDDFVKRNDRRIRRLFIAALISLSIIGLATAASLVGFGVVLNGQQQTANQLSRLVEQNKAVAKDIQQQRKDSIRNDCLRTNIRHDGAVKALTGESDIDQENAPNAAVRREIRRRRDVTISLLDALSPHLDCDKLIKESVPTTGG